MTSVLGYYQVVFTLSISSDYDDTCVNGLLPDTYKIHRANRADGRRGGIALIYKDCLNVKRQEIVKCSQFECIACFLAAEKTATYICIVYRPPPSQVNQFINVFLREWAEFLSQYTTSTAS